MANTGECSPHWATAMNQSEGWARCVGEVREGKLHVPSCYNRHQSVPIWSSAYRSILVGACVWSNCQNMFVLAYMKVDRRLVKITWWKTRGFDVSLRRSVVPVGTWGDSARVHFTFCSENDSSSPESLSSSQDRSSELTSAKLGVGLKSSESESSSSTLTPLLWLRGSCDAPESKRQTGLNSSFIVFMLGERRRETCLMRAPRAKV